MPGPGTPFNSFALPYHIRIDAFTQLPPTERQAAIHLLTHTHTDHLTGLSSKSFSSTIYCSRDAKEMLLKHQVFMDRELCQENIRAEKTCTYSHLKVDPVMRPDGSQWFVGARDLLKPLPLNTPTPIELEQGEEITLTLIDANHCPGAVMYLIEGRQGAVLHTGDFRTEPWFLESLARNPYLQPYLAPLSTKDQSFVTKILDAIYLDTAGAFSTLFIPTKEEATSGLIKLLKCYSDDTYFFINAWTWGYEDVLKSIARAFQCQIHIDRYKYSVYQRVSDPFLRSIVTLDANSTRFHACERFHRCDHVAVDMEPNEYDEPVMNKKGNRVVYINPVTMAIENWNIYLEDTKKVLCTEGEVVNNLLVPLSRHSPLPELQAFVRLFRPKRVVPNSLNPRLRGLDWVCLDHMFETCLSSLAFSDTKLPPTPRPFDIDTLGLSVDEGCDSAIKNILGSSDLATRWAEKPKLRDKLDIMIGYLDPERKSFLNKLLSVRPLQGEVEVSVYEERLVLRNTDAPRGQSSRGNLDAGLEGRQRKDSQDGSDGDSDGEDDHWRTAEALFGHAVADEERLYSKAYGSPVEDEELQDDRNRDHDKDHQRQLPLPNTNNDTRRLVTPPTSPVRRTGTKRMREEDGNPGIILKKRLVVEGDPQVLGSPIRFSKPPLTTGKRHSSRLEAERRGHTWVDPRSQEASDSGQYRRLPSQGPSLSSPPRREGYSFGPSVGSNSRRTPSSTGRRQARVSPETRRRAPSSMHHSQEVSASSPSSGRRNENIFIPDKERTSPVRQNTAGSSFASEEMIRRKRARIERTRQSLELAERLAQVNPGSVAPTYRQARERLLKECTRSEVKVEYLEALRKSNVQNVVPDPFFVEEVRNKEPDDVARKVGEKGTKALPAEKFPTVEGSQLPVDWKKSEELAEKIRKAVTMGRRPGAVIPPLVCTDDL